MKCLNDEEGNSIYAANHKEFSLEVKRIERLLDETVKKLEFAMTIPDIIENNYNLIVSLFSPPDASLLQKAFLKYSGTEETWVFQKADERKRFLMKKTIQELEKYFNEYTPKTEIIPEKDEFDCIKALQILYENPRIRELSLKFSEGISEGAFNFVQDIKFLLYSSIEQMKLTPEEAMLKEDYLKQMYSHHDELLDYATVMQVKTSEQVKKDISYIKSREGEMKIWETKLDEIKKDCKEYIEKSGKEAEKTMILDWKCSEVKQEFLIAQIQSDAANVEMLRKKFVEEEKEFRVKKYQTKQQLIAVLQQYDRDMEERQDIYEYKKEVYEREKEQLTQLQLQYDEQTAEFDMMFNEKNDYERKMVEGRMYEIRCKISARKIQRFYRNYKNLVALHANKDVPKNQASKIKKKKSRV